MIQCIAGQISNTIFREGSINADVISVFLAVDGQDVKEAIANRFVNVLLERLESINDSKSPFIKVEVEYFETGLKPAHYVKWTTETNNTKQVYDINPNISTSCSLSSFILYINVEDGLGFASRNDSGMARAQ